MRATVYVPHEVPALRDWEIRLDMSYINTLQGWNIGAWFGVSSPEYRQWKANFLALVRARAQAAALEQERARAEAMRQPAQKHEPVLDSREVAQMIGKRHDHLLRDIQGYVQILMAQAEPKFGLSDFFRKSSYQDCTGRTLPCYLLTKKGCEMVAHKMTGEKGVLFTAQYINRFHEMEDELQATAHTTEPTTRQKRSAAMLLNAQTRAFLATMRYSE